MFAHLNRRTSTHATPASSTVSGCIDARRTDGVGRADRWPAPPTHPLLQPQRALRALCRAARRPVPVAGREVVFGNGRPRRSRRGVYQGRYGVRRRLEPVRGRRVVHLRQTGRPDEAGWQGRRPSALGARVEEARCGRARWKAVCGRPSWGLVAARGHRGRLSGPRQPAGLRGSKWPRLGFPA